MSATLYLAEIIRLFVGLLLASAAFGKLRTLSGFRHNLVDSFGLQPRASAILAPAIVLAEALLGGLILAGGATTRPGMLAALAMFAVMTALVGYRYVMEGSVKCSCFGESERPVSAYDLLRNGLIIAGIAACLVFAGEPAGFGNKATVLAAAMALILNIAAISFHDIARALLPSLKRSA